ncbi:MAG: hypothetical protein KAY59_01055 [Acidobacteria bacterium]|jgi:hypothetical protein|nr:hypothetical protein [Acidobacteriota bacterium]MDQ5980551.1 hypothetical protein [Verrucomicrobiota bacterium]
MPIMNRPDLPAPTPRNPNDPYWKQALTVLKNAVMDPAQDVMGTNPMAVGTAIAKIPRAIAGAFSMQDEMMRALRGARTAADDVVGVVDEAAQLGPRINASGESAASLESLGRRNWERASGRQPVRIDRAGREVPFIGEMGDIRPNPGERLGYRYGSGRFEELSRGK